MSYGYFSDGGKSYTITTPMPPSRWVNYLLNKEYQSEVDQILQGTSRFIVDYVQTNTTTGFRQFYLHDHKSGKSFHLNAPENNPNYSCKFYMGKTVLHNVSDGIESEVCVFIPTHGKNEMWKVTLKNTSGEMRDVSLFSATGFSSNGSPMGGMCTYNDNTITEYAFPYHVYYEDKERAENEIGYFFLTTDVRPDSCDMSCQRFWGNYAKIGMPAAVKNGKCSDIPGEVEDFAAAMQHRFSLDAGESKSVFFSIGCAVKQEEILDYRKGFTTAFAQKKLDECDAYWDSLASRFTVKTGDSGFDALMNYWFKRQSVFMTWTNRGGTCAPMRNQLQDSLGYALSDPEDTIPYMYAVLKRQHKNGYIKQWFNLNGGQGGLCLLEHCDGPVWISICLSILVNQLGDAERLKDMIPFEDGGEGTLLEHIVKAVEYASSDTGSHGLCLMHDGDWTDPMNGIGRLGKGESTWTTLAAIYAAQLTGELCRNIGGSADAEKMSKIEKTLSKAVNDFTWDEKAGYYYGGWHDDGKPFGYSGDGIIVLNSQSWAVLTGVATGDRLKRVRENIDKISTDFGVYVNYPPFMEWNPRWGRISLKRPGTTENGCVYCHASMFKAAGDAFIGDGDALYDTLYRTTPINRFNPTEVNGQLPLFVPNYYYSLKGSKNFGRSSNGYGTGTVTWFQMLALESLLGARKTVLGIEINPVMPKSWDNVEVTRTFKKAIYHITYKKSAKGISVNGKSIEGRILPYADGEKYEVIVGN